MQPKMLENDTLILQKIVGNLHNQISKQVMKQLDLYLIKELEAIREAQRLQGIQVEDDLIDFAKRLALTHTLVYEDVEYITDNEVRLVVRLLPKENYYAK